MMTTTLLVVPSNIEFSGHLTEELHTSTVLILIELINVGLQESGVSNIFFKSPFFKQQLFFIRSKLRGRRGEYSEDSLSSLYSAFCLVFLVLILFSFNVIIISEPKSKSYLG